MDIDRRAGTSQDFGHSEVPFPGPTGTGLPLEEYPRRTRKTVSTNAVTGDVTTLEDLSVVTRLAAQHDEE